MKYDSASIPESVLRLMPEADRKAIGVMTQEEAIVHRGVRFERELQGQIVNLLRLRGIVVGWGATNTKSHYTRSWPDLTFAVRGIPCAWEVKLPGQEPTDEQAECHRQMRENGWRVEVVTDLMQAKKLMDEITPIN